jgi:Spy/CpxP family protein refolding chaperone
MIIKALSRILLLIGFFAASLAYAQDIPAGKWWYNPEVQETLQLTENEVERLDRLFVDCHRRLLKAKNLVEQEKFELETLLGKKKVDDANVQKQFQRLEKARSQLANERLKFVVGVREIIGPQRLQQLKTSYKKWQ